MAVSRAQEKFIMIGSDKIKKIPHYELLYKHIASTGWIIDDIIDYDPHYTCPVCGRTMYNLSYEFCFECGQLKIVQDRDRVNPPTIKCEDGHFVRSSGEARIDDWLYHNKIEHQYEIMP